MPAKKFYSDPASMVHGTIDAAVDFEFDLPWLGYDVYNIEAEALGIPLIYSDSHPPEIATNQPLIEAKVDLTQLAIPDPYSSARMPFVLEANKLFETKTGHPAPIQFTAPFSLAVTMRGYENLIQDIYEEPEFVHDLLGFATEKILAPWIRCMQNESPNASLFRGADAMASMPLVNVHILKEFVIPYILRLKELCHQDVTVLNWWGESHLDDPQEMLELKLWISPKILQGQDPDVEKLGPALYKAFAVQKNTALILGIGNSFLQKATTTEIRKRIANYIKAAAPGGRFIIYFCYLSTETPTDNIREAVKAVKEYGRY